LIMVMLVAGNMIVLGHDDEDNHADEVATNDVVLDFIPTFYKDVKPIIANNCMGCHMEGQIASYVSLADE
ncbi:MAG TPA: hypothetical protein PLZ51_28780, partial [Aggregatilineales bacterium]|nr:hypothetical protein [Aggregatilineales bacterium]